MSPLTPTLAPGDGGKGVLLVSFTSPSLFTLHSSRLHYALQPLHQHRQRPPAVADAVLLIERQLGAGLAQQRIEKQRVVAKAAAAAPLAEDLAVPTRPRRSAAADRAHDVPARSRSSSARGGPRSARSSSSRRSLLRSSDLGSPARRAECTPGAPPSASTQIPESSASAGSRVNLEACRALASAFSMNVACGSSASGTLSWACGTTSMPREARIRRISRILPSLLVARTSRFTGSGSTQTPSAARCAAMSWRMPDDARSTIASSSARENGLPSAVP